jgi:hypothetical protein
MSAILSMLLPLALWVIKNILKSRDDLKELDKDFIAFVQKLENKPSVSVELSNSYEDQLKKAREEAKAKAAKKSE